MYADPIAEAGRVAIRCRRLAEVKGLPEGNVLDRVADQVTLDISAILLGDKSRDRLGCMIHLARDIYITVLEGGKNEGAF